MKKYLTFTVLSFLLLCTSCTKEEETITSSNTPSAIEITNHSTGLSCSEYPVMSFNTESEFASFMATITSTDQFELDGIDELQNFYSQRNFFDELGSKSESEICDLVDQGKLKNNDEILDWYLSSVLSPDKEIRIANIYYTIGNDLVFGYLDCAGKDMIQDFLEDYNNGEVILEDTESIIIEDKLYVFKTDINIIDESESESSFRFWESKHNKYHKRRKVTGTTWDGNWGVYSSIGTSTKNRKRYCGIWFRADVDVIRLFWNVNFKLKHQPPAPAGCFGDDFCESSLCLPVANLAKSGSYIKNDRSKIIKLFDTAVGFGVKKSGNSINPTSTAAGGARVFNYYPHGGNDYPCRTDHNVTAGSGLHATPQVQVNPC